MREKKALWLSHTLLHESSHSEPEAVEEGEVILNNVRPWVARMGIIPFIRAKPVCRKDRWSHVRLKSVYKKAEGGRIAEFRGHCTKSQKWQA